MGCEIRVEKKFDSNQRWQQLSDTKYPKLNNFQSKCGILRSRQHGRLLCDNGDKDEAHANGGGNDEGREIIVVLSPPPMHDHDIPKLNAWNLLFLCTFYSSLTLMKHFCAHKAKLK